MIRTRPLSKLIGAAVLAAIVTGVAPRASAVARWQDPPAPKVLFDVSPRALEYQLARLTADELVRVERSAADRKYRPVFMALLTRKGVPGAARDEALAALVTIDRTNATRVLLEALAKIAPDDDTTPDRVLAMLFAQPPTTLAADRSVLAPVIDTDAPPLVLRGVYGALLLADGSPADVWRTAAGHPGHLEHLLRAVAPLPASAAGNQVRTQLIAPVSELLARSMDTAERALAIEALSFIRPDAATFSFLAQEVRPGADRSVVLAALRALARLPPAARPPSAIEPLTRAIIAFVQTTQAATRTQPAIVDAIQLGDSLAAALPEGTGRVLRHDLRALGVQVVKIGTIVEQMLYDVRWFVVEAGKPVQIVFTNIEAMPHNFLLGRPGSIQQIAELGAVVPLPTDPAAKAYVPSTPLVLASTHLLKEGETERLNFLAPAVVGEYGFLCTFPGHWTRMYGVMLVVADRDAWELKPTVPLDPLTKMPFPSQRP
ncbi:MAG: plastocyanin/azurin family copper-binding protein [Vicinamibacterales bacterium]